MQRSFYSYIFEFRNQYFNKISSIFVGIFTFSFLLFILRIGFDIPIFLFELAPIVNYLGLSFATLVFGLQIILWKSSGKKISSLMIYIISIIVLIIFFIVSFQLPFSEQLQNKPIYLVGEFLLLLCLFTDGYAVQKKITSIPLTPFQLLSASFNFVILLGTLFLLLPHSTYGKISVLDALFTATSAICVTGLIVVDTGTVFTTTGQTIILILMQIGGLGIITITAFFTLMGGEKSSLKDAIITQEVSQSQSLSHVPQFLIKIISLTLFCELTAATIFYFWWDSTFFEALFHSVSAFCNAGFSLYSDSFMTHNNDMLSLSILSFLIFIGGLGVFVIFDTFKFIINKVKGNRSRISNQSLLVLRTSGFLLVLGVILFFVESFSSGESSFFDMSMHSIFQSFVLRTAGFNSIDIGGLSLSLSLWVIFIMFIGGGSGSTAGGIKINTVTVIYLKIISLLKNQKECIYRNRKITNDSYNRSVLVLVLSTTFIAIITLVLVMTQKAEFIDLLFEAVSAFATVGLSRGITEDLNSIGKILIMISMFIGRIGVVSFALSLIRHKTDSDNVLYPEEEIQIG